MTFQVLLGGGVLCGGSQKGGTSLSATVNFVTGSCPAGSVVLVAYGCDQGALSVSGSNTVISGISDSKGNTYQYMGSWVNADAATNGGAAVGVYASRLDADLVTGDILTLTRPSLITCAAMSAYAVSMSAGMTLSVAVKVAAGADAASLGDITVSSTSRPYLLFAAMAGEGAGWSMSSRAAPWGVGSYVIQNTTGGGGATNIGVTCVSSVTTTSQAVWSTNTDALDFAGIVMMLYEVAGATTVTTTTSLDAKMKRQDIVVTGSLDAKLQKALTRTAQLDGILSRTFTKTTDISAILKKTLTLSADLSALLKRQDITKTASLDAKLQKLFTLTTQIEAKLQRQANVKTAQLDAVLKGLNVLKTTSLDAKLQRQGILVTANLDAKLQRARTLTTDLDAILQAGIVAGTLTLQLSAVLKRNDILKSTDIDAKLRRQDMLLSAQLDAKLQSLKAKTAQIDAKLSHAGIMLSNVIDAKLQNLLTKTVSLDATLVSLLGQTKTASIDAKLRGTISTITMLDSVLSRSATLTVALNALLARAFGITANLDGYLSRTLYLPFDIDAIILRAWEDVPADSESWSDCQAASGSWTDIQSNTNSWSDIPAPSGGWSDIPATTPSWI